MTTYFSVRPLQAGGLDSFPDADQLAEQILPRIEELDVRLLAIRNLGQAGFVFGFVARHAVESQAVVSALRAAPEFDGYRISAETPSIDGPFRWPKKREGRSAQERPSQEHSDAALRGSVSRVRQRTAGMLQSDVKNYHAW